MRIFKYISFVFSVLRFSLPILCPVPFFLLEKNYSSLGRNYWRNLSYSFGNCWARSSVSSGNSLYCSWRYSYFSCSRKASSRVCKEKMARFSRKDKKMKNIPEKFSVSSLPPSSGRSGILFVVATPIGNREDITLRALRTLQEVDVIAAEDTRHTGNLLKHFEISKPIVSCHQNSNPEKILYLLAEGKSVALVTDAGTPGISDPGTKFVSATVSAGFSISSIPGASAFLTALSASGFPANTFSFLGYAPQKKGRETFFRSLREQKETVIFYESTHRILKCLESLVKEIPNRQIVVARELTKLHEEFLRGTPEDAQEVLKHSPEKQKGEFVVLVAPDRFHLEIRVPKK